MVSLVAASARTRLLIVSAMAYRPNGVSPRTLAESPTQLIEARAVNASLRS